MLESFERWALCTMGATAPKHVPDTVFATRMGNARSRLDPFHHLPEFVEIERAISSVPQHGSVSSCLSHQKPGILPTILSQHLATSRLAVWIAGEARH
jgi:hypothetical protein